MQYNINADQLFVQRVSLPAPRAVHEILSDPHRCFLLVHVDPNYLEEIHIIGRDNMLNVRAGHSLIPVQFFFFIFFVQMKISFPSGLIFSRYLVWILVICS